jgi:hypothetical protein
VDQGPSNLACLDEGCEETSFRFANWNLGADGNGPYGKPVWLMTTEGAAFNQDGIATVPWTFQEIVDEVGLPNALETNGFGTATLECAADPELAGASNYQIRLEGFPNFSNLQHGPNVEFCIAGFTIDGLIIRDTQVGDACPVGRYQDEPADGSDPCAPDIRRFSVV